MSGAIAVLLALAAPPQSDPVVVRVNLREVRRSALDAEVARRPDRSVRRALGVLTRRAVLLQEADRSGLGRGLPTEPSARAEAFLSRIISSRVICQNVTDNQMRDMYAAMKGRFVHGDLYRMAELRWHCPTDGLPETAACIDRGLTWAEQRWLPIAADVETPEDLYWLGQLSAGGGPIRFVEYTFHVDPRGKSPLPADAVAAIQSLQVGEAGVSAAGAGARIQLVIEHTPPLTRTLSSPGVADEVRAELCPRLIQRNRSTYVDTLLATALVEIDRDALPPDHDIPEQAFAK